MVADSTRQKVIRAATDLYTTFGVLNISRREIAKSSGFTAGTVTSVAKNRSEFLRLVIAALPYSSVTTSLDVDLDSSENHALHLLLAASRDIWGDPASAWDPTELSALAGSTFDEGLRDVLAQRIEHRWEKSPYVLSDNSVMRKMLIGHEWVQVPAPDFGTAINAFEKTMKV
ncbi:MAG: hypothetical protein WAO33_08020 [Candidatus Nanopelagicales bacterium]